MKKMKNIIMLVGIIFLTGCYCIESVDRTYTVKWQSNDGSSKNRMNFDTFEHANSFFNNLSIGCGFSAFSMGYQGCNDGKFQKYLITNPKTCTKMVIAFDSNKVIDEEFT